MPLTSAGPPALALIACRVLDLELAGFTRGAAHIVRCETFEMGLHDRPSELRSTLAGAITRAEADPAVECVVLVYGLCGLALVDLAPRRCPIVVPRAHDCITLLLGSKERYAACMREEPGTYWYSPGWNHGQRVPGPEREATWRREYTEKYGADDAEALLEVERETFAQHSCAGYVDLGLAGNAADRDYAERCARLLGWRFQLHAGDPALLRDLVEGRWDEARFLIVKPGERIAHSPDETIVRAVPVAAPPVLVAR
ncbi:MAG: DUF1638 domain-containing protein [Opitutaceae bacterium]|nr:DUF1638 domain-containing protein [Opitutaceae bacterium]